MPALGIYLTIMFFLVVIVPVCFVIGAILVAFFFRSKPYIGWIKRIGLTIVAGTVLCVSVIIFLVICQLFYQNSYWNYSGDFDFYRMPLQYPFQIEAADDIELGFMSVWKTHGTDDLNIYGISAIYMSEQIIMGHYEEGFFLIDCQKQESQTFTQQTEYLNALQAIGFDNEPEMTTLTDMWNEYEADKSAWKAKYKTGKGN